MLSRYSLDPFPSHILTPRSDKWRALVSPATNQRSSSTTARKKTRLVVRRGKTGWRREKRSWGGAKKERVPVPVLSGRDSPVSRMCWIRLRYWCSSWLGGLLFVWDAGLSDGVAGGSDGGIF